MKKSALSISVIIIALVCLSCSSKGDYQTDDRKEMDGSLLDTLRKYYVDLSLPSGAIWFDRNYGASSPTDAGTFLAWGESEPKDSYTEENYSLYSMDPRPHTWDQIEGYYGYIPTKEQWKELFQNTTVSFATVDSVACYKFTSKTDENIFIVLPCAGRMDGSTLVEKCYIPSGPNILQDPWGFYWSRETDFTYGADYAYRVSMIYGHLRYMNGLVGGGEPWLGQTVRLVLHKGW